MSIQVENNLKNSDNKQLFEQPAHYMPCDIEGDGPANVDKYFGPYIAEDEHAGDAAVDSDKLMMMWVPSGLSATFRGHPLDGTKVSLPEGYQAVVVTEAKKPLAEGTNRRFQVAGGFKDIVYWNWDKKPSKNDNIIKALDWTEFAEAIHGD